MQIRSLNHPLFGNTLSALNALRFGRFILISNISICTKAVFKRQTPGVFAFLSTGDQGKTKAWNGSCWFVVVFFLFKNFLSFPVLKKTWHQFLNHSSTDFSFLWGYPVYNGMFSTNPGLYPSNARSLWSSPLQRRQMKMSADIFKGLLGIKSSAVENHCSKLMFVYSFLKLFIFHWGITD